MVSLQIIADACRITFRSYYMTRVPEIPPKQLEALRKAGFDPLTRTPFHMVGQDLVLQELLRVLARHAQRDGPSPVSIIFAGPSGHGKSLLSRNIGELLRIPAHTVNMTNLRSQDEFMESRSLTQTHGVSALGDQDVVYCDLTAGPL